MKRLQAGMFFAAMFVVAGSVVCLAAPVKEVVVRQSGGARVDDGFVMSRASVRSGMEYEAAGVSRDVKALLDSGRFTRVDASIEPVEGGFRVTYLVVPKCRMDGAVKVKGADYFSASRIADLIGLLPGDPVDDQVLGVRSQKVVEEYRKRYYPDVSISCEVKETGNGMAQVTLVVHEGARAPVRRIEFAGNEHVPASELRKAFQQPAWWNPMWLFRKKRFDPDDLEVARLQLRDLYLQKGFLDVAVAEPTVTPDARGRVTITVNLKEGPEYKVGMISVSGIKLFPEAGIRSVLTIEPGAVASSGLIAQNAQAVRDYYGGRGYISTAVKPVLDTKPDAGKADLEFIVTEGELNHIRNIVVQGNTRTKDKVIRRELLVCPGDIYDEVKVRRSEKIVNNLGYFSSVRSFPVSTRNPAEKDLVFQMEETFTGNIMVGAGFSSVDKVMGFMELQQGNFDLFGWPYFTGGGQKLKLAAQVGSTTKSYDLSFTEPWFLDRKLSLSTDFYRTENDYSDYDVTHMGAAIGVAHKLFGPNRIDYRYRVEQSDISGVADTNEYFYVDPPQDSFYFTSEEGKTIESSFTVTVSHDTRDNPFVATRGRRATVFATLSGGPLGFDVDIYRLGFNGAQYVPLWFRHVLSLKTRWETVDSYGELDEVPLDNRLYLGGGRTLRGFHYRDVGPKVERVQSQGMVVPTTYHRPAGGQTLGMASAEYSIPIFDKFRVAAFYDIGGLWRDPYDVNFDTLASSYGVGLRLDIPRFPIRIDYAKVLQKDNDMTRTDPWVFWIGYDF